MNTLVHFDQMRAESGCIIGTIKKFVKSVQDLFVCSHFPSESGFHGLLGNPNQRKMAVALALSAEDKLRN